MKNRLALALDLKRGGLDPMGILSLLTLQKALSGCESVLDIGCGATRTIRDLGVPWTVGIDGYLPSVEKARQLNTHDQIVHGNVGKLMDYFQPRQFDACVALDLIEHLPKEDGLKLLRDMETVARKKVIILTPSGFKPQGHTDADDLQVHLSGWEPDEMNANGYQVTGLLGPKQLLGDYHRLKYSPRIFWGPVAFVSHILWTKWHPQDAAAILCVKNLATN